MLYRATRDGFKANDFWQRCAGKGPTLTIVKVCSHKCRNVHCVPAVIALQLLRLPHRDFRTILPLSLCAQAARNGFISGAFTPVSWPADAATRIGYLPDPSGRTFLFSLVNAHGRAVKLRLKADQRAKALYLGGVGSGPGFGFGADLHLIWPSAANHSGGCLAVPSSFELDHETEAAAGLAPIAFAYDKTLLAGNRGEGYDSALFAAAEIEVYQL